MRFPVRSIWPLTLAVAFTLTACPDTDPNKSATWTAKLTDKDTKVVIDALDHLRKMKAKDAVAQIVPILKTDDGLVREAAAAALEDVGDASTVQPLIDAVDFASSEKTIARANRKIADALGSIGDKAATPTLIKMLKSHDDLLRVAALESIDKIRDPLTIPALIDLVNDELTASLVTKLAIVPLGDMRSKEAIPVLAKALVMERRGVSFFVESSYALFQIGSPAVPALSAILNGDDKEYVTWAENARRAAAGYVSKCAIVLADIGDPAATPALVKALKWKDPSENSVWENLVRGKVAEALGRLRAQDAATPIAAALGSVDDANMRALFAVALAHIGDKKQIPKLEAAIKNMKDTWSDRQETMIGLAMFADGKEKPLFEAVQKTETVEKAMKECLAQDTVETAEIKQDRCKKSADERVKVIVDEIARLAAGDECKEDVGCWAGKLKDTNPKVRERAAFELGKSGNPAAIDPLVTACKDDTMFVRRAAYIALDWLTRVDAVKPALKAKASVLAGQLDAEKSSATTQIVNEDLKRVVWKLQLL